MYSPEIMEQLKKFANADMRMARKEGSIIIARTKKGNVDLSYTAGSYKITQQFSGQVLYQGKAKGCREAIINLYDVR